MAETRKIISVEQDDEIDIISVHQSSVGIVTADQIPIDFDTPIYDGNYIVTPSTEEQTLQTKNKAMRDNVTVLKIPYYETTNEQGGYTVIIGE